MQTVERTVETVTEVNRSKFIAYLLPYTEFEGMQEELKARHPKANHVVYALRYLNTFEQVVENSSDDGEPKGCAGVPALNVLRGEAMINCAVLIVRYFGGIKLGTGGMARAYAKAVKDALKAASTTPYEREIIYEFTTDYSSIDKILHRLKQLGITQIERDFGVGEVVWKIKACEEKIKAFRER
ncbi:IMPACT family protein [Sulfurovum sp. ST-21]|uniref:YigZ family protein n=1 Tax=Sulfurovum indicum TaxID=2779528 RepID=A0A7M1S6G1_9BACT|nr:YigZ family protein [Sulfurovum indicum]QOR62561.1 YigZ family protein [Sulfurovum indicum]